MVSGAGLPFPQLVIASRAAVLIFPQTNLGLRTHPFDVGLHDTAFDRLRRCRPAASSVCTLPLSLWAGKYPLTAIHPASGSYCGTRVHFYILADVLDLRRAARTSLSPEL